MNADTGAPTRPSRASISSPARTPSALAPKRSGEVAARVRSNRSSTSCSSGRARWTNSAPAARQGCPAGVAMEEHDPELGLDPAQLARHERLVEPQGPGGGADAAGVRDRDDDAEVTQLQVHVVALRRRPARPAAAGRPRRRRGRPCRPAAIVRPAPAGPAAVTRRSHAVPFSARASGCAGRRAPW